MLGGKEIWILDGASEVNRDLKREEESHHCCTSSAEEIVIIGLGNLNTTRIRKF